MRPADPKFRVLYAAWAFLEVIAFGGLIYGWGSLVYILKDEGIYMELCATEGANSTTAVEVQSISLASNSSVGYSPLTTANSSLPTDDTQTRLESLLSIRINSAARMPQNNFFLSYKNWDAQHSLYIQRSVCKFTLL